MLVAGLGACGAAAGNVFTQASVKVQETYTTNANLSLPQYAVGDWITEVVPSIVMVDIAKRFQFTANVSLDFVDYLHRTEPNRVLPTGQLGGVLEVVKDHLFFDAGVTAAEVPSNLLAPTTTDVGSSYNVFTAYTYHASPELKGDMPLGIQYDLRSDNAWTRTSGQSAGAASFADTFFGHNLADVSSAPKPIGAEVRVEQSETLYTDSTQPLIRQDAGRLIVRAQVDPQLLVGLRGGVERENFVLDDRYTWIRGAEFDWRPTDRSDISASAERRYFGTGFNYSFSHRNPWFALSLVGGHNVVTTPQQLFSLPATGNVAALVDAMLTTEYPDPVARAQATQNLMASQGLPSSLAGPMAIFAPSAYLSTSQQASLVWTGRQSSVTLSLFDAHEQVIPTELTGLPFSDTIGTDNDTTGASIGLHHDLTPFTVFSADVRTSNIQGTGAQSGTHARQDALSLQLTHNFSMRSSLLFGARYQYFTSNTLDIVREIAGFVGVTHRF